MLNTSMKHIIYKTTHSNGKYYIGRHSTENINDGYLGSGKWIRQIKDRSTLSREILATAETQEELIELEGKYLTEHVGKPGCMNNSKDPIGFDTDNNPMKNPESVAKISGDNHWLKKDPSRSNEISLRAKKRVSDGTHNLLGKNSHMKKPEYKKAAAERMRKRNLECNPSTILAAEGRHHWQNGNAPNAGGKLNKKLIAEGRHNLVGPEHNRRMIAEGKNPWVGSAMNEKMLAEGRHPSQQKVTCEHCGMVTSKGMYKRWHGEKCKQRKTDDI